jgi:hypothetical protein
MMNILPWNPADREAKSPCDKNIRYPVCVPGHDSPNGTTFLAIVVNVYDKQKTSGLVDDQVTWSTLVDSGFWPGDTEPGDNLLVWSGHLDHPRDRRFSYNTTIMHQAQNYRYLYRLFVWKICRTPVDNVFFWINPVEKCTRSFPRCYVNRGKVTSWRLSVTPLERRLFSNKSPIVFAREKPFCPKDRMNFINTVLICDGKLPIATLPIVTV